MSSLILWLGNNAHLINWMLILLSWFASTFLGYKFGARKYAQEKAELIFEEVALLIDKGNQVALELLHSFDAARPPQDREQLWIVFTDLQRTFWGNTSRLQFLLNKYFGGDVATKVDFILRSIYREDNARGTAEEIGHFDTSLVGYFETWTGIPDDGVGGDWYGYKWRMMEQCGMNTKPILKSMRREREEREKQWRKQEPQPEHQSDA